MSPKPPNGRDIDALIQVMADLRDPETGCPWDVEQTFETIAPYTIEEAYEVADAIERGEADALRDELGDLLLQVIYHSRMAEESGQFAFADVVAAIVEKMIRRHPHVYRNDNAEGRPELAKGFWEDIKAEERANRAASDRTASLLDDVPRALPALSRAAKLQKRAARVGFDWPNLKPVFEKAREEIDELEHALETGSRNEMADEVGDILFVCANLARHLSIDPEDALTRTNHKFARRFRHIEHKLAEAGRKPADASLVEMEGLWEDAKRLENGNAQNES